LHSQGRCRLPAPRDRGLRPSLVRFPHAANAGSAAHTRCRAVGRPHLAGSQLWHEARIAAVSDESRAKEEPPCITITMVPDPARWRGGKS
jgi:hypothetical protein